MIPLGYFGAAGLLVVGGINAIYSKRDAKLCLLGGVVLGASTKNWQMRNDIAWIHFVRKFKVKQISAGMGLGALSWIAFEEFKFVERLPIKK